MIGDNEITRRNPKSRCDLFQCGEIDFLRLVVPIPIQQGRSDSRLDLQVGLKSALRRCYLFYSQFCHRDHLLTCFPQLYAATPLASRNEKRRKPTGAGAIYSQAPTPPLSHIVRRFPSLTKESGCDILPVVQETASRNCSRLI